jgi:hypothetical protein
MGKKIIVNSIPFNLVWESTTSYNIGEWLQFVTPTHQGFPFKVENKESKKKGTKTIYTYKLG